VRGRSSRQIAAPAARAAADQHAQRAFSLQAPGADPLGRRAASGGHRRRCWLPASATSAVRNRQRAARSAALLDLLRTSALGRLGEAADQADDLASGSVIRPDLRRIALLLRFGGRGRLGGRLARPALAMAASATLASSD
jgi:hypothetical protein